MSQHDFDVANQGFPSFRADMNAAFQALASQSSGATAPTTMYAYQLWYDTTTDTLKMRNADNDAWISIALFDQVADTWSIVGLDAGSAAAPTITPTGDTNTGFFFPAADTVGVSVAGTEAVRVDSSGNVGIGTSSPTSPKITVNEDGGGQILLGRQGAHQSAYMAWPLITARGDGDLGSNQFGVGAVYGFWYQGAGMTNPAAETIGFRTGSSERMRIDSAGNFYVGKTTDSIGTVGFEHRNNGVTGITTSSDTPLVLNRQSTDGELLNFRHNNIAEGSISISGTTVSYNGGHLARWSRLPDGADDTNILKGTVMTNLDQMIEWVDEDGSPEDNEQLNFTNTSSVEGDPNVAGVFVAWDDSDEWGDYYLAMTGDMVIRIAQGVTVQQGDLLMSAGDGTAKPQEDDLVRSKTIAKVISTNKSHEYADGSYCVPCVLMAC